MEILFPKEKGDLQQTKGYPPQSKINLRGHQFYESTVGAACANHGSLPSNVAHGMNEDRPRCRSVDSLLIRIENSYAKKQNKSLKALGGALGASGALTALGVGKKRNKVVCKPRRLHLNDGKQCVPLRLRRTSKQQQLIEGRNVFEQNFPVGYYIARAVEQLTKPGPPLRQAHVPPKINQITGEAGKKVLIKYKKQQVVTIDSSKYIRKKLTFENQVKKDVADRSHDSPDISCLSGQIETHKNQAVQHLFISQQLPLSELSVSNTPLPVQNNLFVDQAWKEYRSPRKIKDRIHVTNQEELNRLISVRSGRNLSLFQKKYLRVNLQVNAPVLLLNSKQKPRSRSSLLFKFMPTK